MATRTVEFTLSDQTKANLQAALENLAQLKLRGYQLSDIRIEDRDQAGTTIQVGVIEATN